jgi:hypothetical protein
VHVLLRRAWDEVGGVYARFLPARVVEVQLLVDGAVDEFVRGAMRVRVHFPLPEMAVSGFRAGANPNPAGVW